MPYSLRVKHLAYQADPECWISYSGKNPAFKRRLEVRRIAALEGAARLVEVLDKIKSQPPEKPMDVPDLIILLGPEPPKPSRTAPPQRRREHMPPMKIAMLLHFYSCIEPFAPEPQRTSPAYTQFVRELLADGLVVRPSKKLRAQYPGWAYRTTEKGDAFVRAVCATPLPVAHTHWRVPK